MKKLIFLSLMLWVYFLAAQTNNNDTLDGWAFTGFFQQNLNQVNFTNWAAGGENSFSSTSKVRFDANFGSELYTWENYADLIYGMVKLEDTPMRKNNDKIDVFSKFGRRVSPDLSISSLLNFISQFDKGYQYPNDSVVVSRFMAPGYLTIALGIDYKPWEFLSLFLSPATGKFTFVLDQDLADAGAFGVEPAVIDQQGIIISQGEKVRSEFGALVRIEFKQEVVTNVNVNSRITLFNNYTDSNTANRKNTDIDWITTINMPINRYITASINLHLIYDHDILIPQYDTIDGVRVQTGEGPTTQFMQSFGLGLVYNF